MLKRSEVSCSLTMGIRIDTSGEVTATDLLKSSGNAACDTAAREWAKTTRWSTAYNRDQPVIVWISQPLTIETR
jgi:TonB family protein